MFDLLHHPVPVPSTATSCRAAPRRHPLAFTLLELIVVIVILGILALLAIPTFQAVITKAEDSNTQGTLASLVREASALAAFRGETTFTVADFDDALADLPAAAVGVMAQGWVLEPDPAGFSADPSTVHVTLGGSPVGSAAGLALTSSTGNCAMALASGVSAGVQGWVVDGSGAASACSGAVALAGPGPVPLELSYASQSFSASGSNEVVSASASGGVGPYTFEVASGTVPDGVSFNAATGAFTGPGVWPGMVLISSGHQHTCGVDNVGAAWCWGSQANGRLGDGVTTATFSAPVRVAGLDSGVTSIAAGSLHTCAIHNGAAKCWGSRGNGRLGNGQTSGEEPAPAQVVGLESGVTSISVGSSHSCAVHNGAAKCWGAASSGKLGNGRTTGTFSTPVQVTGLDSVVTAISTSDANSCAVHNGAAKCWGTATAGELGNGQTSGTFSTPVQVVGLESGVTAIAAGSSHSCAIHNGAAKCWGSQSAGRLGNGQDAGSELVPAQAIGLESGVTAISVGSSHSCAVHNGAAKCWGHGLNGRVGVGVSTGTFASPVQVNGIESGAVSISAGSAHACVVQRSTAKCWGSDAAAQLGNDPDLVNQWSPVPVAGFSAPAGFPATLTVVVSDGVSTASAEVTLTLT